MISNEKDQDKSKKLENRAKERGETRKNGTQRQRAR